MAALLIFNAESSPRSTARAPCTTRLVDAAGARGPAVQLRAQRRSLAPSSGLAGVLWEGTAASLAVCSTAGD